MFEESRYEYSVKTCPSGDTEALETLLNGMSEAGWDLYTLHETESRQGGIQYNCIFYREVESSSQTSDDIIEVDNFQSRIEKMLKPSEEPYEECRELQDKIARKQQEVLKIKNQLESGSEYIDYNSLNQELSDKLKELDELKTRFSEAIGPARMYSRINKDKITIILSDELIELVNIEKNGELVAETVSLRQKLADELGYIIPVIKFTNSETLEANEFRIDIRGIKVLSGYVYMGYRRFYPGESNMEKVPRDAIRDIDPVTGQESFWIEEEKTKNFWEKGLDPSQVITGVLEHVVCKYVNEIMEYSDINGYIELVSEQNLLLVDGLIPDLLSLGNVREIFVALIRERVPVNDLIYVFERLNDLAKDNPDQLLPKLRIALSRQICSSIADESGNIYGIALSDKLCDSLDKLLIEEDERFYFDGKNPKISSLINKILTAVKDSDCDIENTALISTSSIRLELFNLFESIIPGISVLSRNELSGDFNLEVAENINSLG